MSAPFLKRLSYVTYRAVILVVVLSPMALGTLPAAGQVPAVQPGDRGLENVRRDRRREAPRFLPPAPEPDFRLPPLPPEWVEGTPGADLALVLEGVVVTNSTVLSEADIADVAAPYLGRPVTSADLQSMRYGLTRLYTDRGYINSGVVIPDQDIVGGVVTYRAVEGSVEAIEVTTSGRLRESWLRKRIARGVDEPVNVNDLRETLQMLQQDGLVERLNSTLIPGTQPGSAVLSANVQQGSPWLISATLDNSRAPSVGSINSEVLVSHRSVLGFGDALSARAGLTRGLLDADLSYRIPLGSAGASMQLAARQSESDVVEEPFDQIDIGSETEEVMIVFQTPLVRTLSRSVVADVELGNARSKTTLLGRPFSFSPGVIDGRSEVSALRLSTQWLERRESSVLAVRSTLSFGLGVFDATISDSGAPDSSFMSLLSQVQWARRFGAADNELILRGDFQFTDEPLLPLEKYALGGQNTVRGYRQNLLVRDNGWLASVEVRRPLSLRAAPDSDLMLAAFVDFGRGWNKEASTPSPDSISSAGVGLRFASPSGLSAQLYAALPFRNVEFENEDLQDAGIHFRFRWQRP